jgi:hypothetical protein
MGFHRPPLYLGAGLFKATTPNDRYDPKLVHAIATRRPEEIEFYLEHFSDPEINQNSRHDLTLHQLNHLEQHAKGLLNKPFELAIALHGIEETTEENSYSCIRVLALNFEKLIEHAAYFNYPTPNLNNILKKASENKDPVLHDLIVALFAENKENSTLSPTSSSRTS